MNLTLLFSDSPLCCHYASLPITSQRTQSAHQLDSTGPAIHEGFHGGHCKLLFLSLCAFLTCMNVPVCPCPGARVWQYMTKGQRMTCRGLFSLLPCRSWALNSDCQAWWQKPLPLSHLSSPNFHFRSNYHVWLTLEKNYYVKDMVHAIWKLGQRKWKGFSFRNKENCISAVKEALQ